MMLVRKPFMFSRFAVGMAPIPSHLTINCIRAHCPGTANPGELLDFELLFEIALFVTRLIVPV